MVMNVEDELTFRGPKSVGHYLRQIRKTHGLTQQELAERAGVTQHTISKLENGNENSEIGTIFDLLKSMGYELKATLNSNDQDYQKAGI